MAKAKTSKKATPKAKKEGGRMKLSKAQVEKLTGGRPQACGCSAHVSISCQAACSFWTSFR